MIAVISSCGTNLTSVKNALNRLNADYIFTDDKAIIEKSSHLILPGVGSAAKGMQKLQQSDLITTLQNYRRPILGICLGMQLLYEWSQEGEVACLGLLRGKVRKLSTKIIPHMGWNQIKTTKPQSPVLKNISAEDYFYFVHSFVAEVSDYTLATTDYTHPFSAIVNSHNIYGVQFHPERSSHCGQQLLKNFIELSL